MDGRGAPRRQPRTGGRLDRSSLAIQRRTCVLRTAARSARRIAALGLLAAPSRQGAHVRPAQVRLCDRSRPQADRPNTRSPRPTAQRGRLPTRDIGPVRVAEDCLFCLNRRRLSRRASRRNRGRSGAACAGGTDDTAVRRLTTTSPSSGVLSRKWLMTLTLNWPLPLHRRYPASQVLRTSPPPQTAQPVPHGRPVEGHAPSPLGFPVLRALSVYRHAVVITPVARWALIARGTAYSNRFPVPSGGGLPHHWARSATTLDFSRPANVHWLLRPVGSPSRL